MKEYAEAGCTTFDMADIYGPAEDIFGHFMKLLHPDVRNGVQGLTTLAQCPSVISLETIQEHVDKAIVKMGVSRLHCLQLHWRDYSDTRYIEALQHVKSLQSMGKIIEVSVTNFDTKRLEEIVNNNIDISTVQVQYSLIDQRPTRFMKPFCEAHSIKILAYGTLCGGLLTDKYVERTDEPKPAELSTPSLRKYKKMVDAWGGWGLFQRLLSTLRRIADKHQVSVADIALRSVLDDDVVAGVIVGARFGAEDFRDHLRDNFRSVSFSWSLDAGDRAAIGEVSRRGHDLMSVIGDCGSEYR